MQIPDKLIENVNKLVRTSRRMLLENGREPSLEELAERVAMPPGTVRRLLDAAKARGAAVRGG